MTHEQFVEKLQANFDACIAIVRVKNKDYADDVDPFKNFRSATLVDISVDKAILVRVLDKLSRTSNLLGKEKEPAVADEKVVDTILDAINYLNILKVYLENK